MERHPAMIISASYRTDIPAFYPAWFRARLEEGGCTVINPYGGRPYTVHLDPASVDGFVFWSRNIAPFADALKIVAERGHPFVVQMTITGYPRALDRSVIPPEDAIAQLRALVEQYDPDCAVWRYDPVLITDVTPAQWHRRSMEALASALAGVVNEVVLSHATIYRKTRRNLDRLHAATGIRWYDPSEDHKAALLTDLGIIAARYGMTPTLCSQDWLLGESMAPARCIDPDRLSRIAGRSIRARRRAARSDCRCGEARDIGGYETCPHGCIYCYAVESRDRAVKAFQAQSVDDPALCAPKRGGPAAGDGAGASAPSARGQGGNRG